MLVLSFACSFVRLLVRLFVRSFVCSLVVWLVGWFVCSFDRSFACSFFVVVRDLKQRRFVISFVRLRDYFNSLNFYKMATYPGTKLVGVAYKLRKKMKNSSSCIHVLHKTLNVVISRCCFAEGGKEMYQNVKRTCRAIVCAH